MAQQHFTAWGLYRDAADPRLFVPKRNPAFGWTINLAHRRAKPALVVLAAVVAGSVVLARVV